MKPIQRTDAEWKKRLTPAQYKVLREEGTEIPFTSPILDSKARGMYSCAGCGHVLFPSDAKFDSGTGWPSFDTATENVKLEEDHSFGMVRTAVICKHCGGHLGHLFDDGPTKTRQRYCVNGCALTFTPRDERN